MKSFSVFLAILSVLTAGVHCFPTALNVETLSKALEDLGHNSTELLKRAAEEQTKQKRVTFDPIAQRISTTGAHAFVPPGPGDVRGPCPGLNAMANHGYLPHNGVSTLTDFVVQNQAVFGCAVDTCTLISTLAAVLAGNGNYWSIGGVSSNVPSLLSLLGLGTPAGLSGSHNRYESDGSPTRGDLYQTGDNVNLNMTQFSDLLSRADPTTGLFTMDILTDFRASRFDQSVANNPYFWYGPAPGILATAAAYSFIFRFMANNSVEYPQGYLTADMIKTFYSVTGTPGNYMYTPGCERIPDNWYKRAVGNEYSLAAFILDLLTQASKYPKFLSIGGNTGRVNTFTPLSLPDLTNGVYNLQNLLQGNNAFCLAYQAASQGVVDLLAYVLNSLLGILGPLGCPDLATLNKAQYVNYPGSTGA